VPKSKASKGPVSLHPLLADFMLLWKQKTPYSQPGDWVFPSFRLEGKQPRVANMLVEDHLRPAAVKAGILSSLETCEDTWLMTTHDDLAFIICVTASHRF